MGRNGLRLRTRREVAKEKATAALPSGPVRSLNRHPCLRHIFARARARAERAFYSRRCVCSYASAFSKREATAAEVIAPEAPSLLQPPRCIDCETKQPIDR